MSLENIKRNRSFSHLQNNVKDENIYEQSGKFINHSINEYLQKKKTESYEIQQKLLEFRQNKGIKIVEYQYPCTERDIKILDISLTAKGGQEDTLYAHNKYYYENIRRGNSLLIEKKGEAEEYYWGRKGMKKFFDLQKNSMKYNLNQISNFQNSFKSHQENKLLHQIIFDPIQEIINKNKSIELENQQQNENKFNIEIVETVKANGENAQISYNRNLELWIIASKNVTILAKDRQDLQKYYTLQNDQRDRFNFAALISETWFDILEKLHSQEKIDKIKDFLSQGNTFIGEYVGNQECQHLVKYEEKNIVIFTIVNYLQSSQNNNQTCISPFQSQKICQELGLDFVEIQQRGQFTDFCEFNKRLFTLYEEIEKLNIDEGAEGSVLYFLVNDLENQSQQVLSVCKMKTLEYRFYRKLREKLKNHVRFIQKQGNNRGTDLLRKFSKEIKELAYDNNEKNSLVQTTPQPLQFYEILAKKCFDYVSEFPNHSDIIQEYYITFISRVLHCLFNGNIKVTPDMFEDSKIPIQHKWSEYDVTSLLNQFTSSLKEQKIQIKKKEKKIKVIVPMNIPGSGKSTFNKILKENIEKEQSDNKIDFYQVSSDLIRQNLVEMMVQRDKIHKDTAFQRTKKKSALEYNKQLKEILNEKIPNSNSKISYIFLDKNHPTNALKDMFDTINGNYPNDYELEFYALVPQSGINFEYEGGIYPFSLEYMIECIHRVQQRKEHPTLLGQGWQSLNVMIMFIQLFKDVSFSEAELEQLGFTRTIYHNFNQEQNIQISPQFKQKFLNILDVTKPGKNCQNQNLIKEFSELFESQNFQFAKEGEEQIRVKVQESYKQLIQSDQQQNQEVGENKQQIYEFDIAQLPNLNQGEYDHSKIKPVVSNVPLYCGIFAQDYEQSVEQAQLFLRSGLIDLKERFKDKRLDFQQIFDLYKFPQDGLHITSIYIGRNQQRMESEYFQSFEQNLQIQMKVSAFIIIPDCIITGITVIEEDKLQGLQIENQYPHVTLMTGKWTAYKSNILLHQLFENHPELEQKLKDPEQEFMEKYVIAIEGKKKQQFYVYKPKNTILEIQGITKMIYR